MKKLFVSKSVMKKIALALVFMILFQVVVSRPVEASGLGGTLLSPIVNLVVYLADGAISILQESLTSAGEPFEYFDISGNKTTIFSAIGRNNYRRSFTCYWNRCFVCHRRNISYGSTNCRTSDCGRRCSSRYMFSIL